MNQPKIKEVLGLLRQGYGSRQLIPHYAPLSELVRTILSQNTSDINSRTAFRALQDSFNSWEDLLNADPEKIMEPIKSGGLGKIKAHRIQQALLDIKRKRGKLDLAFLGDMPISRAREWLKQLPGVGNKTANCVLLFALGKPALPVDTHISRIAKRLKFLPETTRLDDAHLILENIVPADDVYEFHVLMIEHGRQICKSRNPLCFECILNGVCPSYDRDEAIHAQGKSNSE